MIQLLLLVNCFTLELCASVCQLKFASALQSWLDLLIAAATVALHRRRKGQHELPTFFDWLCLITGISTQAGAGLMTTGPNAPALTYFERLFWSQASQNAAAAVVGKAVR